MRVSGISSKEPDQSTVKNSSYIPSCKGKMRYDTYLTADKALKGVLSHDKLDIVKGFELIVYRCRHCNGFHLGESVKRNYG